MLSIGKTVCSLKNFLDHLIIPWLQNNGNQNRASIHMMYCSCLEHQWTQRDDSLFSPEPFIDLFVARGHVKCAAQFGSQVSKVTTVTVTVSGATYNAPGTALVLYSLYLTLALLNITLHCQDFVHPPSHQKGRQFGLLFSLHLCGLLNRDSLW